MVPNVRGPDKQKRKRAAATFSQNARTQKKRHNNKLATAAEGTARLDAFVGTRGTSREESKNTGPKAVDGTDDAWNDVEALSHRDVSVSTTQAGDGTAARGSQQNTTYSSANAPRTGGHAAGSGSQQPQVGGCFLCTPVVFNPPPLVTEIDVDDDDIDLDEDEDDEGIGFSFYTRVIHNNQLLSCVGAVLVFLLCASA